MFSNAPSAPPTGFEVSRVAQRLEGRLEGCLGGGGMYGVLLSCMTVVVCMTIKHVGFPPTRQTLLAPSANTVAVWIRGMGGGNNRVIAPFLGRASPNRGPILGSRDGRWLLQKLQQRKDYSLGMDGKPSA